MSNVGYCTIDFAEHGFSDVCRGGGVQHAPNWTCVARCAGKTNWCSYVIAGLSGWSSGVCLVVAMGSIGSTEWPWSGVARYVYLVMNTNIRLSCDI